MKAIKTIGIIFATAILFSINVNAKGVKIYGTTIRSGNNLVGLITDATTGKGLKGIPVSDGFSYTYTDNNGVYQMKANARCRFVNYTTPAGYKVAINRNGNVAFYAPVTPKPDSLSRNDFALQKLDKDETNFTLVAISDPQCKYLWHGERYQNETIPDIQKSINEAQAKGKYKNVYAVTLGDETYDHHDMFQKMREYESGIKINGDYGILPVFNAIGNHDHNFNYSDSDFVATRMYCKWFGPTDYSFNRGNAHIVVIDDVLSYGTGNSPCLYNAGFTAEQMKWLKADLATVKDPANTLLIFCTHIPFKAGEKSGGDVVNYDKYYKESLQMMTAFHEVHLMIGHTHCPENYTHDDYICKGGKPIFEHIHAAVCGGWWYSNLCLDGTPNGYAMYEIRGNSVYDWVAKGTGLDYGVQMRVYNGNDTYSGDVKAFSWDQSVRGCFIASVFYGDGNNWKVDLVYGGKTYPMQRVDKPIMDVCAYAFHINVCHRRPDNASWQVFRKHFWVIKAPSGNPGGIKDWKIIATQTIPSSGVVHKYECSSFQKGYDSFVMYSDGTRK